MENAGRRALQHDLLLHDNFATAFENKISLQSPGHNALKRQSNYRVLSRQEQQEPFAGTGTLRILTGWNHPIG